MRNAGLGEWQAGTKIGGRNINNLRSADDTTLMAESEEELNSLLMRVKEESGRAGLRLIGPITSQQIEGEEMEAVTELLSLGLESLQTVTAAMESEDDCFLQESDDKPRQCVEKQRLYSANKYLYSEGCGLPSGHVRLWDGTEGRAPKNWCLQTVVLEETPESPSESKETKPDNLKGN